MADMLNKKVKTPIGEAPVIPVIIMSLGAYLSWFAVHYWRSDTKWPTDPLKAVLTGKPIPEADRGSVEEVLSNIEKTKGSVTEVGAGTVVGHSPGAGATKDVMTKEEIKVLWTGNGGAAKTAAVAAAVAMAESSGRTYITSPNPDGGTNVGLWQLDTRGVGAGHTVDQLKDPATNARITIMGSANGTNWSHWEAYTKGKYKDFL